MKHTSLPIMIELDGKEQLFPVGDKPVILTQSTYSGTRMGDSAPQITASFNYYRCLKDEWQKDGCPYVVFNGERFILLNTPTSKKSNDNLMFTHEVTFVAERVLLDREFFYDVVAETTEKQYADRYRSNHSSFNFMGTIDEFASRFNDSLVYVGLCSITKDSAGNNIYDGYHVVVDDNVPTDDIKEVSFENQKLSEALKYINSIYELAYYWKGKECHIGLNENTLEHIFEYGEEGGLLSISDTNNGEDIITRITGTGSSDNIPFYYPNDSYDGSPIFRTEKFDKELVELVNIELLRRNGIKNPFDCTLSLCQGGEALSDIVDLTTAAKDVNRDYEHPEINTPLTERYNVYGELEPTQSSTGWEDASFVVVFDVFGIKHCSIHLADITFDYQTQGVTIEMDKRLHTDNVVSVFGGRYVTITDSSGNKVETAPKRNTSGTGEEDGGLEQISADEVFTFKTSDWYNIRIEQEYRYYIPAGQSVGAIDISCNASAVKYNPGIMQGKYWADDNGAYIPVSYNAIEIKNIDAIPFVTASQSFNNGKWNISLTNADGAGKIIIYGRELIHPSQNLMPSIYRDSKGAQRYYHAKNKDYVEVIDGRTFDYGYAYENEYDDNNKYKFANIYNRFDPHAAIQSFEDIKPSIRDMRNNEKTPQNPEGELLGEIKAVAFDDDDSDELINIEQNSGEYKHSYFYIQLHKFNGDNGFNLFDQALESDAAKIDMITGNCASCSFEIGVTKYTNDEGYSYKFKNPVQVKTDGSGKIVSGNYLGGGEIREGSFGEKVRSGFEQEIQQDTRNAEVWIAVKKENSTFGVVMPNATWNYRPNPGDRFVITGIKMPKAYVLDAEKRLDKALVKYMFEHNEEKFNCNITFSRIWIERHPDVVEQLSENSKVKVRYNNIVRDFYVKTYTVKHDENIISEISVELTYDIGIDESELSKRMKKTTQQVQKTSMKALNSKSVTTTKATTAITRETIIQITTE